MQLFLLSLVLFIQASFQPPNRQKETFIFEDPSNTMQVEAIYEAFRDGEFERLESKTHNPGFTKSTFWLALRIPPEQSANEYYYVIGNPHINWISFFEVRDEQIRLVNTTGDHLPFPSRPLNSKLFAFPIKSSTDSESLFFVKISKHHESLQISQELITIHDYYKSQSAEQLMSGILIGIVILLVLFGLSLFLIMADSLYIYYAAFILSGFLWISTNLGLGYQLWWSDFPMFANKARPIFSCAQALTALLFLRSFLKLENRDYVYYINKALVYTGLAILIFFAVPIDYSQFPELVLSALIVHNTWNLLLVAHFAFICIKESVQGNRNAWFFLLAFTALIVFSVVELLAHTGTTLINNSYLSKYGVQTGYMVASIILTFGLVFRFNTYKKEQERLLKNINRQQQLHSERLRATEENERYRIAKQLKNDVGSSLEIATTQLSLLRDLEVPQSMQEPIQTTEDIIHQVNNQIQTIGHLLVPFHLKKLGFAAAISYFCDNINYMQNLRLEYLVIGFEQMQRYRRSAVIDLYRIVQELLSDVIQQSSAKNAFLQVIEHDDKIIIVAEDNGKRTDTNKVQPDSRKEEYNIRSKINYLKGELEVINKKEGGILVYIQIPLGKFIHDED